MTKHKHADLIKAWADGAVIQYETNGNWVDCDDNKPEWYIEVNYRVKPEKRKCWLCLMREYSTHWTTSADSEYVLDSLQKDSAFVRVLQTIEYEV